MYYTAVLTLFRMEINEPSVEELYMRIIIQQSVHEGLQFMDTF